MKESAAQTAAAHSFRTLPGVIQGDIIEDALPVVGRRSRRLLGTREQPLPQPPRARVDDCTNIRKQFGCVLNLVEDYRRTKRFQEGAGITPHPCLNIRIFEQDILGFRKKLAQKSGLACTARSGDNNCWKVSRGILHDSCQSSLDISHMRNIN
jgi:hypothetical protein